MGAAEADTIDTWVQSTCGSNREDKLADPRIDPRLLQALEVDGESSCSGIMSVMAR